MTSSDMYNEFVRYFERMGDLYKEYAKSMDRINQLYTESIKNVERMNELYKELIKTNDRMNELYKDIQRINLEWLDLFWRPFLAKEEEKKDKTHKEEHGYVTQTDISESLNVSLPSVTIGKITKMLRRLDEI